MLPYIVFFCCSIMSITDIYDTKYKDEQNLQEEISSTELSNEGESSEAYIAKSLDAENSDLVDRNGFIGTYVIPKSNVNILDESSTPIKIQNIEIPKDAIRSIRVGQVKTNPESVSELLRHEMADLSPDLKKTIVTKLEQRNIDHKKFRDVFLIKKRIIDDGKRKIINFNISEKIIPRHHIEELGISRDFGTRALLGGILFLLAGLVLTTTMKMYQSVLKKKYFKFENRSEIFQSHSTSK